MYVPPSNEAPYNNAKGMVPDPPAEMGVTHMVYSRNNKVTEVQVIYDDVDSVKVCVGVCDVLINQNNWQLQFFLLNQFTQIISKNVFGIA